jgi:hypothetical protein
MLKLLSAVLGVPSGEIPVGSLAALQMHPSSRNLHSAAAAAEQSKQSSTWLGRQLALAGSNLRNICCNILQEGPVLASWSKAATNKAPGADP